VGSLSDAGGAFLCTNLGDGGPLMCAAHQWCVAPCVGCGPPPDQCPGPFPTPFCVDDESTAKSQCPGGSQLNDHFVTCQCP
jgi:hypothetical protein